jgi:hypothetical protein
MRDNSLAYAGDAFGLAHRQFAVIECADDRGGQGGAD